MPQWSGEDEGILELTKYLHCFPLAGAQAAEYSRVYLTATSGEYLDELKRVGLKAGKGRRKRDEYPECFPDVIKLSLDRILQSDQAHAEEAGQVLRKLAPRLFHSTCCAQTRKGPRSCYRSTRW